MWSYSDNVNSVIILVNVLGKTSDGQDLNNSVGESNFSSEEFLKNGRLLNLRFIFFSFSRGKDACDMLVMMMIVITNKLVIFVS